ncbi:BZ3500_MvSof-1268-A1-R1_Chr8-1g09884 [Microbotryum saponariae]|uniref:BZ3500_MvSof-1268-A1-R1_Chr8-1g09884 protein n=1 Tax=Microbotryum saponariae TaxID=289078 RepID=A0A2X0KQ02_9BASI|nr:BZ3500_MvSof-1268-A1-R1_Chr8-1g09884 [Microbotryum saponariae]SDA08170.1 BZ3501_MvSof-1269-A2-R1_Chr8-1g09607 [Microbotryum saponariae]
MSGSGPQSGGATSTERTSLLQPARSLSRNGSGGTPNHGAAAQASSNGSPLYLADQRPRGVDLATSHKVSILVGTFVAVFVGSIDTTVTASLIQPISADLHASHQASWLGTSYLLASLTFTPSYGRLCDILGRRYANASAITLFLLGTLGCALAPSMPWLIAARFLAGCGGGGMTTTSAVITADLFSLKDRVLIGGVSSVVWASGSAFGGPFVPILLCTLLGGLVFIKYSVEVAASRSTRETLSRIDFGGCASLFFAFAGFLTSLSLRNNELLPWSDPRVIISTALTPIFLAVFVYVESNHAREPILPLGFLRQRTPFFVLAVTILMAISNFALMYHLPIYFLAVESTSAGTAGAHLLPTSAAAAVGGIASGIFVHRTGRYWLSGLIVSVIGALSIYSTLSLRPSSPELFKWLLVVPFGFALSFSLSATYAAMMAFIPPSQISIVTGATWLFRSSGQIIGVGVSSAVFQGLLVTALRKEITGPEAEGLIKAIREDSTVLKTLQPELEKAARNAFAMAVKGAFGVSVIPVLSLEEKETTALAEVADA